MQLLIRILQVLETALIVAGLGFLFDFGGYYSAANLFGALFPEFSLSTADVPFLKAVVITIIVMVLALLGFAIRLLKRLSARGEVAQLQP